MSQTCNIFVAPPGRGAGGGVQFNYLPTPTYSNVPCSIQGRGTEVFDEQRRITAFTDYIVILGRSLNVSPRDMIQYTDASGNLRTLYVSAEWDMAGRGSAFGVPCTERQ
jgi:hypothetical protein